MANLAALFGLVLSLLGPPDRYSVNAPKDFELKEGDQIVAIGDSITAGGGYLKDADAVLASQYPDLKLPPIINVGISGQKAEDLVKRFDHDVVHARRNGKEIKPAIVTLSIGINDVWHRASKPHDPQVLAEYWRNVEKMVDMAQAAGIKVVLLTPTVIKEDPASPENQRLAIYVDAEKEIARAKNCTLIDLHQMFLDALAKRPEDTKEGKDKEHWLTGDGVHMKPTGDALMAVGVLRGVGVPDEKIKAVK